MARAEVVHERDERVDGRVGHARVERRARAAEERVAAEVAEARGLGLRQERRLGGVACALMCLTDA